MKRLLFAGVVAFVPGLLATAGHAQDTVKIGIIMPYSGQFADAATQMDDGIKLYSSSKPTSSAAKRSRSSARTSAASIRRSPNVSRKSW